MPNPESVGAAAGTAHFTGWFEFESAEEAEQQVAEYASQSGLEDLVIAPADLRRDGAKVEIEVEAEANEARWEESINAIVEFANPALDGEFDAIHRTDEGDMVVTLTFDDDDNDDGDVDDDGHDHGHDHGHGHGH